MADQVTISTFLELRDNLSEGLRNVAKALEGANIRARRTQDDQARAADRSAREQAKAIRAVNAMLREQEKARERTQAQLLRSAARTAKEQERYQQKLTAAIWREEQRRIAMAERTANARIRAEARAARDAARARRKSATADAAPEKKPGLLSTIVKGNLLSDAIERAAGYAFNAVRYVARTTVEEGNRYEKTINSIAASMDSLDLAPSMRTGQQEAKTLFAVLRERAGELYGEAQDYVRVFSQGLPDAISRGMSDTRKYAEFVSKYTHFAISRNVSSIRAATDLEQILQGRARITTRTYAELRPHIGMLSKDFNTLMKTDPSRAMNVLVTGVERATQGISEVANTFDAMYGKLRSLIQELFQEGGENLFVGVKDAIGEMNRLLIENKAQIMATARVVSQNLANAFVGLVPVVSDLVKKFVDLVNTIESSPILSKMVNIVSLGTYGLGKTTTQLGAATRERKRTEEDLAILQKYEGLLKGARPGDFKKTDYETILKSYWRATAYSMKTGQGAKIFESKQDWDSFVRATGADPMKLWKELTAAGVVEPKKLAHGETLKTAPGARPTQNFDFRNSRFDIKQEFAEGFDPDRIAVAFTQDLARAGEMKLQSGYAFTGMVP